ncbi:hypothetical protein AB5I41_08305 [Sphingomonas sp. MMS24-JH45]
MIAAADDRVQSIVVEADAKLLVIAEEFFSMFSVSRSRPGGFAVPSSSWYSSKNLNKLMLLQA